MKKALLIIHPCLLIFLLTMWVGSAVYGQAQKRSVKKLLRTKGLVALWDFKEEEGKPRKAQGPADFPLQEQNGTLPRINEGPLSGYSTLFGNKAFLSLPNAEIGKLNIYGKNQGVTVRTNGICGRDLERIPRRGQTAVRAVCVVAVLQWSKSGLWSYFPHGQTHAAVSVFH